MEQLAAPCPPPSPAGTSGENLGARWTQNPFPAPKQQAQGLGTKRGWAETGRARARGQRQADTGQHVPACSAAAAGTRGSWWKLCPKQRRRVTCHELLPAAQGRALRAPLGRWPEGTRRGSGGQDSCPSHGAARDGAGGVCHAVGCTESWGTQPVGHPGCVGSRAVGHPSCAGRANVCGDPGCGAPKPCKDPS